MSRKTLIAAMAVLGAVGAFFSEQFGLTIGLGGVMAALASAIIYIRYEAKLDAQRFITQAGKFKDPKFWLAFASMLIVALNSAFGWHIPVEIIVTLLTVIMGVLFKKESA